MSPTTWGWHRFHYQSVLSSGQFTPHHWGSAYIMKKSRPNKIHVQLHKISASVASYEANARTEH